MSLQTVSPQKKTKNKALTIGLFLAKALGIFHLAFVLIILLFCILYNFVNPPFTSLMLYRSLFNGISNQNLEYLSLDQMSGNVARMTIAVEDNTFYRHNGIELSAINRAIQVNAKAGYSKVGGSTITQQLARTLFLFPDKWLLRKYLEIIVALEMELIMSKERILELYLNYAEWGRGVYGIGKAALHYYKKPLYQLDKTEKMALITILPNPIDYTPKNFSKSPHLASRYERLANPYSHRKESQAVEPSETNSTNERMGVFEHWEGGGEENVTDYAQENIEAITGMMGKPEETASSESEDEIFQDLAEESSSESAQ